MSATVRVQDVIDEMDTVSQAHQAYLNRQTGELVTLTDEDICAVEEEHDLADYSGWQQNSIQKTKQVLDSDDYLPLPNQSDIHEYSIIERFCYGLEDVEVSNSLLFQIKGTGAFQRFKHAIHHHHISEDWYQYRQKALEDIAIAWLEANTISYELTTT